jgi:hypothetical protein
MAFVTFHNSMAVPTPAEKRTTMEVSLSSRYRNMTSWQPALIRMLRAAGGWGRAGRSRAGDEGCQA